MLGGKLASGAVAVGSKVVVAPSGEAGVVKTIEVDGQVRVLALRGLCYKIFAVFCGRRECRLVGCVRLPVVLRVTNW